MRLGVQAGEGRAQDQRLLVLQQIQLVEVQGERDGEDRQRPERAGEEREAEPGQEPGAHRREAAQVRGGVVPPAGGLTGVEEGDQDRAAETGRAEVPAAGTPGCLRSCRS